MIDTELRLSGDAAVKFHKMMTSIDLESIKARDEFLADVNCKIDDTGVLSIDISDIDIDLSILADNTETVESVLIPKEEMYIGKINISYASIVLPNLNINDEKNTSYKVEDYYVSSGMYSVTQSVSIKYAA
jgi:uncharacterized protein (UPF0179 family)